MSVQSAERSTGECLWCRDLLERLYVEMTSVPLSRDRYPIRRGLIARLVWHLESAHGEESGGV